MTSIEWLVEQLKERGYAGEFPPHLLFEQAKEMHEQELMDAHEEGYNRAAKVIEDATQINILKDKL